MPPKPIPNPQTITTQNKLSLVVLSLDLKLRIKLKQTVRYLLNFMTSLLHLKLNICFEMGAVNSNLSAATQGINEKPVIKYAFRLKV